MLVGLGTSAAFSPLLSTVARWFTVRRGLMLGISASGIGTGTLVVPPLMGILIDAHGWRSAYVITGASIMALIVAAAQLLRRPAPQVDSVGHDISMEFPGLRCREALRTGRFWAVCGLFTCCSFLNQLVLVHVIPYATDMGTAAASASGLLSMVGGMSIAGRIIMGSSGDRTGCRPALAVCFTIMLVSLVWLQYAWGLPGLYMFSAVFGFAYGGLIALMGLTIAELFGLKAHGMLLGITNFAATSGGALGPLLAGRIFDTTGSYSAAFWISAGVSATGLGLALMLPRRKRASVLSG